MSSVRTLAAACGTTVLVTVLFLLPSGPALAATCQARVNYEVSSGLGAATEFNSGAAATRCALVQVKIRGYLGGGVYQNYLGPQSATSSHREASANSYTWFGRAKPSTTWSEQQWTASGEWKNFHG